MDVPAWIVKINLEDTSLENASFVLVDFKEGNRWVHCFVEDSDFNASCSPDQLEEVMRIFREWAESK